MQMIKKPPSKAELSAQIQRQTESFLRHGDKINQIPKGVSSRDETGRPIPKERWQMERSASERTYLPEVVDALEQRKQNNKVKKPSPRVKKPRKRLIYDDFGEPLRWVWVDD